MTLADYGSLAEIIGVLGMIASLIYVGYQLQQARVQMRGQAAQARLDSIIHIHTARGSTVGYADLLTKGNDDPDSLSPSEWQQVMEFEICQWEVLQTQFYQMKLGLLDEDQALGLKVTEFIAQQPVSRQAYEAMRSLGYLPQKFCNFVDSVTARYKGEDQP